ncbi:melanoma-associated antigen B16-like [Phyllostomus hastatus]|uniref:melanoma-associated antigen B16-like n=1 Tax=Phyllostomus hastatus TaxID=9423 RepID=UPI001E683E1F|nr:melanoma-associated antigen B16-like [Phyllostomus hastatus]XP_045716377.1 LOW QUALITY PROTEIN: melanoma-associated antigen B16-like [Phyllostomus hastatus]XP_045716378.1 melanoma-associated antigen B16-like [Phyllostomus hastatus]
MAFNQKNPQSTPNQPLQSCSETQGLEAAQAPEAVERACLSSDPPMPGSLNEAPAAGIPSSPESPQSFCTSSIVTIATSSCKSGEESSSQEEEGSTSQEVFTDALDDRVALLVDFLLVKYHMKEPITKAEMLIIVREEYQDHFTDILLQASERMEMIFGLDVKEIDPIHHCYAIVIKLGLTYDGMLHGEKGVPKTGILILLLGAIFMNGNRATEEEIWKILSVMKLYPGKKHAIFGDPSCLITKHFVEEEYLKYQQVANSDPAQFEFLWGPRTHAETTKMQVLTYLAKVYGSDPSSFPSQYEEAFQEELERSQARIATVAIDYHGHSQF